MPNIPIPLVSATTAMPYALSGQLRSCLIRNKNTVAGDTLTVTMDSGEIFVLGPAEDLEIDAEDTSSEGAGGKIATRNITFLGAGHNITMEANYTFYSNTRQRNPAQIEVA